MVVFVVRWCFFFDDQTMVAALLFVGWLMGGRMSGHFAKNGVSKKPHILQLRRGNEEELNSGTVQLRKNLGPGHNCMEGSTDRMVSFCSLSVFLMLMVVPSTRSFHQIKSSINGDVVRSNSNINIKLRRRSSPHRCPLQSAQSSRRGAPLLQMSLYNRIRSSVQRKFPDGGIDRVVDCWDRFVDGQKVEKFLDSPNNLILQKADCYVEGLSATCFHDLSIHPWAVNLESKHQEILTELEKYHARHAVSTTATNALLGDMVGDWLPPRDSAGNSYGPEWKTLGLQDRSVWDDDRIKEFPHTVQILQDLQVPSCEVFFAKQGPKSGIKPHSDKNNFIITCHLALDVPEGECWIQVGNEKYYWKVNTFPQMFSLNAVPPASWKCRLSQ